MEEGTALRFFVCFISIKIVYSPFANWIDDLTVDDITYPDCITRGKPMVHSRSSWTLGSLRELA